MHLLLYAWVLRKKFAEAEESCGFFEYSLYSLVLAWVLWKLLDANPYFATIRMGFERILEMLSLYSWVLSKFLQGR